MQWGAPPPPIDTRLGSVPEDVTLKGADPYLARGDHGHAVNSSEPVDVAVDVDSPHGAGYDDDDLYPQSSPGSVAYGLLTMPARCPIVIVLVGLGVTIVTVIIGLAALPVNIETDFDAFLKTDVQSSVMRDAFNSAKDAREGNRRLRDEGEKGDNRVLSRLLDEQEALIEQDAREGNRRLRDEGEKEINRLLDEEEDLVEQDIGVSLESSDEWEEAQDADIETRRLTDEAPLTPRPPTPIPPTPFVNGTPTNMPTPLPTPRTKWMYSVKHVYVAYELMEGKFENPGLFDTEALIAISVFEKMMRNLPMWLELCARVSQGYTQLCDPGLSFVSYAMPTADITGGRVVPAALVLDGRGSEPVPLQTSLLLVESHGLKPLMLPSSMNMSNGSKVSGTTKLRSGFRFRIPVCTADTPASERKALVAAITADWEKFVTGELMPFLREGDPSQTFKVWFDGTGFHGFEVKQALNGDISLAASASAFVLAYLFFHTRSFLLGLVGLALTLLSVPLAFILSAILIGTTTVSFASFLALFLVVGFGADVIFVYTDFWRDSARVYESYEDRLAFTYQLASRASLATTATTALSFFANLASVIRALREFGFFMGLCVMLVWGLITVIYAPLCMIDEMYLSQYAIRAWWVKPSELVADEGSKPESSARVVYLERWAKCLYRGRFCWCAVPLLTSVIFIICAVFSIQMQTGLPSIFPEDHNMNAGKQLMEQFETGDKALPKEFKIPEDRAKVCNEQAFGQSDATFCALYWCESSWSPTSDPEGNSCGCWRRDRPEGSCNEDRQDDDFEVVQRFVTSREISKTRLTSAVETNLKSNSRIEYGIDASTTVTDLPPMLLQEWETGDVDVGFFKEVVSQVKKSQMGEVAGCGWEDLCFCGEFVCTLNDVHWQEMTSRLALAPQQPSDLQRRLAPSNVVGGRRRVSKSKRAKVRVAFGLKVARSMPLLGGSDDAALWKFMKKFKLQHPWAQRSMYTFCSEFPKNLRVEKAWCWMEDFRDWLHSKNERFPTLAADFDSLALEYIATSTKPTRGTRYIWLHGKDIKGVFVSIEVNFNKNDVSEAALKYKKKWDDYIDAWNEKAMETVRGAFHVSELWVSVESQAALLVSTGTTLMILIGLAFCGMLIFTRSLTLSIYVVLATVGVVFGLAFFITVMMGWQVGLIEVIAVIYFVGYAVTYSLHVGHKYGTKDALELEPLPEESLATSAKSQVRLQRTSFALKAIGGAALGSAITTAGTSFFLVFCTLTIFTKLGAMCLAVTIMSIFTALGPLPAALMIIGPQRPGECLGSGVTPSCLVSTLREFVSCKRCCFSKGFGGGTSASPLVRE